MRDYLLIHHVMLPLSVWCVVNYFPTGHSTFAAIVTSAAHVLLYGYKLICGNEVVKNKVRKYLKFVGVGQSVSRKLFKKNLLKNF